MLAPHSPLSAPDSPLSPMFQLGEEQKTKTRTTRSHHAIYTTAENHQQERRRKEATYATCRPRRSARPRSYGTCAAGSLLYKPAGVPTPLALDAELGMPTAPVGAGQSTPLPGQHKGAPAKTPHRGRGRTNASNQIRQPSAPNTGPALQNPPHRLQLPKFGATRHR